MTQITMLIVDVAKKLKFNHIGSKSHVWVIPIVLIFHAIHSPSKQTRRLITSVQFGVVFEWKA